MSIEYKPLTLSMIEEGRFLREANALFKKVHQQHGDYVDKYGQQAEGSVSEITLKVKIGCQNVNDRLFAIVTGMTHKLPSRPANLSTAVLDKDVEGQAQLWGKVSGTRIDRPEQGALCTEDGRTIDPDTGQVIEVDADGCVIESESEEK